MGSRLRRYRLRSLNGHSRAWCRAEGTAPTATSAPEATAEWMIDLTGDTIVWRHAHEEAAVTVRGPLTGLLLVVYRRRRSLVITLFRGAGGSRG